MNITKRLPGLPIERTLGVLSGRWKAVIIYILMSGPKRICELKKQIVGMSQEVLLRQLGARSDAGLWTIEADAMQARDAFWCGTLERAMTFRPAPEHP
jgi:DNA-binding HxlR family transcriptional regulator